MEAALEEELEALLSQGRVNTRMQRKPKKGPKQTDKKASLDKFGLNALLSILKERQSPLDSQANEECNEEAAESQYLENGQDYGANQAHAVLYSKDQVETISCLNIGEADLISYGEFVFIQSA